MRSPRFVSALVLIAVAAPASAADPAADRLLAAGNEHEYNLRLDQALSHFHQALEANPNDPAAYRAVAALEMMKIAFRRGAVTADSFLGGDAGADIVDLPKPPTELASSFRRNAERALQLAEQQVQANPNDAESHYQLGSTIALQASYSATIDGRIFAAFKLARRAYKENTRALEIDPRRHDAGLTVGVYQYIVSLRSLPMRWVARIAGMDGDRARALELIEAAARYPGANQTDARLMLALIYNRDQRYDEALTILTDLQSRYPDNRLLWLEAGATALRAGRFQKAQRTLDEGFPKLSTAPQKAFGEDALWHYKRGAALVGLHQAAAAAAELNAALRDNAPSWIHGRSHAELGKLADLTGDRGAACQEYRLALQLGKAADDSIGVADAEHLLEAPYQKRPTTPASGGL
jgi:tetratricopeptide (TPR) repeat protein